jgi:pimeloyl-ACP methyl ester carboxylesterase
VTYTPKRPARHEYLSVRGLKHRLTWWDGSTRRPIVLLHGFQDCGDTWQFLVDRLPCEWSLVAPDWRGFGGSEWSPGGYWFPDYLADLEALLDILVPAEPAGLIAHSMGATAALLYAGVRPDRIEWLVNLEGLGRAQTSPGEAPARYAQWLDQLRQPLDEGRYESVQQLADLLRKRNPRLPADHAAFVARAWTRDTEGGVRLAFDPRHRHVNPVLYRREESEACWRRTQAPMLLIAGDASSHQERRLKEFSDEYVMSRFPRAQIAVLQGLGHMMHHEDPRAVAERIVPFVQGCR